MSVIEYPRQSFDKMTRKQAITTCLALEDMRDRAVAEVERLRADLLAQDTERVRLARMVERVMALIRAGSWNPVSARADIRAALEPTP